MCVCVCVCVCVCPHVVSHTVAFELIPPSSCPRSWHQSSSRYFSLLDVLCVFVRGVQVCMWLKGVHREVIADTSLWPSISPSSTSVTILPLTPLLSHCVLLSFCILFLVCFTPSLFLPVRPGLSGRDCSKKHLGERSKHSDSVPDPNTSRHQATSHAPRWYFCIKAKSSPFS